MELQGLIVGLGNPGPEYDGTRHNIGFMTLDALRSRLEREAGPGPGAPRDVSGAKHKALIWKARCGRYAWLFAKPLTFMNRSGETVASLCRFYRIPPERILVVHDELDLPLGRMKFKTGGGTAGHNGLNSIVELTGNAAFHRLRIGIGKPEHGEIINWVLSRFRTEEAATVAETVRYGADVLLTHMRAGAHEAVRQANGFKPDAQLLSKQ